VKKFRRYANSLPAAFRKYSPPRSVLRLFRASQLLSRSVPFCTTLPTSRRPSVSSPLPSKVLLLLNNHLPCAVCWFGSLMDPCIGLTGSVFAFHSCFFTRSSFCLYSCSRRSMRSPYRRSFLFMTSALTSRRNGPSPCLFNPFSRASRAHLLNSRCHPLLRKRSDETPQMLSALSFAESIITLPTFFFPLPDLYRHVWVFAFHFAPLRRPFERMHPPAFPPFLPPPLSSSFGAFFFNVWSGYHAPQVAPLLGRLFRTLSFFFPLLSSHITRFWLSVELFSFSSIPDGAVLSFDLWLLFPDSSFF